MESFLDLWSKAAITTLGLFWMAFWAFCLGYLISAMIQVFVTRERMQNTMGETGARSVFLGTFFGFISSSCSFAALSTTRALFSKGAGLIPSLAFLLASTNLVVELGIIIGVFLGWQFVVGEYVGGLLLILLMWITVTLTLKKGLEQEARQAVRDENASSEMQKESPDWKALISSVAGWKQVAKKYLMEWKMVWKDVTIGFTIAGIIAVCIPKSFFEFVFIGSGSEQGDFLNILFQTVIGPVAAFFTFIGSMGNIPLATVLYSNGVSFAGVMAFIFSDLVVFPVLRIQAEYYGWKMALYILGVFLFVLVTTSLLLHYGFQFLDMLPGTEAVTMIKDRHFFEIDYTLYLNLLFLLLSIVGIVWHRDMFKRSEDKEPSFGTLVLNSCAYMSLLWLASGLGMLAVKGWL